MKFKCYIMGKFRKNHCHWFVGCVCKYLQYVTYLHINTRIGGVGVCSGKAIDASNNEHVPSWRCEAVLSRALPRYPTGRGGEKREPTLRNDTIAREFSNKIWQLGHRWCWATYATACIGCLSPIQLVRANPWAIYQVNNGQYVKLNSYIYQLWSHSEQSLFI